MKIFVSYATDDLSPFRVPDLVDFLEYQDDIERVYYWDRDCGSNKDIIEYMEDTIQICDKIIFICSENSKNSGSVKREIKMAVYLDKSMVPIFRNIDDVTLSVKPERGIKFGDNNFDDFLEKLYFILTGHKPKPQKKGNIFVYIIYSAKDTNIFKIEEMAARLSAYKEIKDVISPFGHGHPDYLEDSLARCDVIIACCSESIRNSRPVFKELEVAESLNIPIIPVFTETEYIPLHLQPKLNVKFDPSDLQKSVEKIYSLILQYSD